MAAENVCPKLLNSNNLEYKKMGNSIAQNNNTLAQKFSANCGIKCEKLIDGEYFKFKNGKKGGFWIKRICPVNGDCMMEATLGALANVMFAAPLSSNAKEISQDLPSGSASRQEIYTSATQTLLDHCNIDSTNKISNVEFLTTDQKFDGPVSIVHNKTMKNNCAISAALNASALAMSPADNPKNKKGVTEISLLIVILVIVLSGSGVWVYMKKKTP